MVTTTKLQLQQILFKLNIVDFIESQSHSVTLHLLASFLISALCVLIAAGIYKLVKLFLSRQKKEDIRRFYKKTKSALILNTGIISFTIALETLPYGNEEVENNILDVNKILIIACIGYLLIKISAFVRDLIFHNFDINTHNNLRQRKVRTQIAFIYRLSVVVITIVCVSLILMSFEDVRKIGTSLLASAGVATVIIGFAAQRSLANLLAGFQIAFTQPIRIDDVVIVENEWGKIEEINLTYVVVKIWDERRMVLPISYFIEKPFQNWTKTSADILGTAFLYVDYSFPIPVLRDELKRILNEDDPNGYWDKRVNVVQVTETTEYNVEVRILVSARDAADAFELRCLVREKLISFIQQHYPGSLSTHRISMVERGQHQQDLLKRQNVEPSNTNINGKSESVKNIK